MILATIGCSYEPDRVADPTPPDSPGHDAPLVIIDAAPDAPPIEQCTTRYGGVPGFQLCDATPTSCRFFVVTNEDSCSSLCSGLGGICIDAHDGNCGTTPFSQTCLVVHFDQVCICAP